jgi:hypothetical protein
MLFSRKASSIEPVRDLRFPPRLPSVLWGSFEPFFRVQLSTTPIAGMHWKIRDSRSPVPGFFAAWGDRDRIENGPARLRQCENIAHRSVDIHKSDHFSPRVDRIRSPSHSGHNIPAYSVLALRLSHLFNLGSLSCGLKNVCPRKDRSPDCWARASQKMELFALIPCVLMGWAIWKSGKSLRNYLHVSPRHVGW